MELEQYLEKDIIAFLESKAVRKEGAVIDREEEYGLYITKDYLKELNYALDNDELTKAKKLFDELKSAYSRLPKSSSERKKIYSLLEKMYDKIQNYVNIKEGRIEVIKQGDSEIQRNRTERFSELSGKGKDNLDISTEVIHELAPARMYELPIMTDEAREDSKKHPRKGDGKKRDDVSVESNILGKSTKETTSKAPDGMIGPLNADKRRFIPEDYAYEGLDDLEEEIIDRTITLERLKMQVTEHLLSELRKKLEEDNDEHNKKIEEMRKDIIGQMIEELDKRFDMQSGRNDDRMEHVKEDILKKVFEEAPHMISSNDYGDKMVSGYGISAGVSADENSRKNREKSTKKSMSRKDIFIIPIKEDADKEYMIPLSQKSIPEDKEEDEKSSISIHEGQSGMPESSRIPDVKDSVEGYGSETESADSFGSRDYDNDKYIYHADTDSAPRRAEDITENNDEKVQEMYEEAIYTMFQNNYDDAAKILRNILELKPKNKAAKYRLRECAEAAGNA